MRIENKKSLESLSLYCHIGGLITIFLGMLTIGMDAVSQDWRHIQSGIYIFISGYALVKIASRISTVITNEKD